MSRLSLVVFVIDGQRYALGAAMSHRGHPATRARARGRPNGLFSFTSSVWHFRCSTA